MKRLFLLALLCCFAAASHAQWDMFNILTFDPGDTFNHLITIDTVHYHHNIWQVGAPHKTHFTSAYTAPYVMVTDTANPYPQGDTSAFILRMPTRVNLTLFGGALHSPATGMWFYYQLRKDSGSKAKVEVSVDNGAHWHSPADTVPAHFTYNTSDTLLSGDSVASWTPYFIGIDMNWSDTVTSIDTILFRFTFISDSATPGKDGWMIDNMMLQYYAEAVPQVHDNNIIALYPNPTSSGNIYLHATSPQPATVNVYDMQGREVYRSNMPPDGHLYLPLPNGTYMLRYNTADAYAVKRLVITR